MSHTSDPADSCVGSGYRREFRDLDTKRLPTAPPRPGSTPNREDNSMSKTQTVMNYLRDATSSRETAISARRLVDLIHAPDVFDITTVSALLRMATKSSVHPHLHREERDGTNYWWLAASAERPSEVPAAPAGATQASVVSVASATSDEPVDSILRAIAAVSVSPGIPNAPTHAARLRALADSPIIDGSIAFWLGELADLVEQNGRAAA